MLQRLRMVYRKYCPLFIRKWNVNRKDEKATAEIKKEILNYYCGTDQNDDVEIRRILQYWKKNPCRIFNDEFIDKYIYRCVQIYRDERSGFPYVIHDEKKMYFKQNMTDEQIVAYYNSICMEQDEQSPHHYFTQSEKRDLTFGTVVDIGGAEGNFSLEIVEKAKEIFIFECDEEWIKPLRLTFAPWQDKVHIIQKFVSDNCNTGNETIDSMFAGRDDIDVIKMDVEGEELSVLQGAHNVLSLNRQCLVFACVYHYCNEKHDIERWAEDNQCACKSNDGYMLFLYDNKPQQPPYFREGVVRLKKV